MKTLKTTIFTLILFLGLTSLSFGQQMAEIQGKVINNTDKQPVSFATVALYNKIDSLLVTGSSSNEKGEFKISKLKPDNYYIKISYVGFQNKIIDDIQVTEGIVNIGNIFMSPEAKELDEIVIKADRLIGKEELGKTVYNINDKVREVAASGLDVLKYIPSVSVGLREDVTLEGRSDILFYVDDIERDKDFVAQLDPKSIDKIEIITNPSAKYSADISGVIKVYRKREKKWGLTGNLQAEIPTSDLILASERLSLDFGNQNIRFFVSDRFRNEAFNGGQVLNTTNYTSAQIDRQLKSGKGRYKFINNNFNYGFDWFINDKNTLNFYGNNSFHDNITDNFIYDSKRFSGGDYTEHQQITENTSGKGSGNYFSLFYKKEFSKPGQELTTQVNYYDFAGNNLNTYNTEDYDITAIPEVIINNTYREEITKNKRNTYNLKLDYTQPIGKVMVETGYFGYYQTYDNSMKNATDAVAIPFIYDEQRHAGYLNLAYKVKTLSIQAGLRSEYSKTNIDDKASNEYFCLLPQVGLNLKLKKGQNLKLNFRRRIYRPNINELNPFENWSDSLHVTRGNSNLKPAYSNNLELAYSKNFKANFLSPKIYAKYITDNHQFARSINSEGVTESNMENIGKSFEYGLAFTGAFQLTKWWRLSGFTRVANKIVYENTSGFKDINKEKVVFRANIQSIINPYKDFNFFTMLQYRTPDVEYQSTSTRDLLFIIGLEKSLFKNKSGKLTVIYLPPYIKTYSFEKTVTDTPDLHLESDSNVDVKFLLWFQFSYRFSTGKKVKKLKRSTDFDANEGNSVF